MANRDKTKFAMNDISCMLRAAEEIQKKHKAIGILLTGDFNARHSAWGDSITTQKGKQILEQLDDKLFTICTSLSPTFLCVDGSSHIDLLIVSQSMFNFSF